MSPWEAMFSSFGEVTLPCQFGAIGLSLTYLHMCCPVRGKSVTVTYIFSSVSGGWSFWHHVSKYLIFLARLTDTHIFQWLIYFFKHCTLYILNHFSNNMWYATSLCYTAIIRRNFSHRGKFLSFKNFLIMNDITGKYKILNKTTWSTPIGSLTEAYQTILKNPQGTTSS